MVFSGDLTYRAKAEEYETAWRELLESALKALELPPERLFMVPGNHDLDRGYVYKMLPAELQEPLKSDATIQEWLTDDSMRERALEPFKAYCKFVADTTQQRNPDYASVYRFDKGGQSIVLLGLNSAWRRMRFHRKNSG